MTLTKTTIPTEKLMVQQNTDEETSKYYSKIHVRSGIKRAISDPRFS